MPLFGINRCSHYLQKTSQGVCARETKALKDIVLCGSYLLPLEITHIQTNHKQKLPTTITNNCWGFLALMVSNFQQAAMEWPIARVQTVHGLSISWQSGFFDPLSCKISFRKADTVGFPSRLGKGSSFWLDNHEDGDNHPRVSPQRNAANTVPTKKKNLNKRIKTWVWHMASWHLEVHVL